MVVKIEKEREPEKLDNDLKIFWNWLWNSESIWSYIVFLVLIFLFVKFIFLPGLSLAFGMGLNGLPLAIVESSSMDHNSVVIDKNPNYQLCGNFFPESKFFNKEEYWQTCGIWYEQNTNITKDEFSNFKLANGFRKGDLIIIFGKKYSDLKVGDILIFNAGRNHPIIHRVVGLNPLQTKGDHNQAQLTEERNINEDQIIGVAVGKIPYVGWVKLGFYELIQKIRGQ
jgi:hypothetical protein